MSAYPLYRDASGAYILRDGDRDLVELRPAEPNWWTGRRLPGGHERRLYGPHDGTPESEATAAARVARQLL